MKSWSKIVVVFVVFFSVFSCRSLLAGEAGQPSLVDNVNFSDSQGVRNGDMTSGDACHAGVVAAGLAEERNPANHSEQGNTGKPSREVVMQKIQTLHVPFIANNGQVDEQVTFYAKTFGGTVFVTKEGEIVYSLPSGRDVPAGASQEAGRGHKAWGQGGEGRTGWHGQAPLVRADAELVAAHRYAPFLRTDDTHCPPDRVLANALLSAYLPGLQEETTRRVVSTETDSNSNGLPANNNPKSAFQNSQSPTRGVALKERLVGGKIGEIRGGAQSATTVSYFKGNDPSKWKSNISAYEVVDMGEVYKGIGLKLKAYGNNVEKLFTVKPGASPERIKIRLDGLKECGVRSAECGVENSKFKIQNSTLQINDAGELVAETELGPVKFTKPVAYQEIDGKRVEVECGYTIADCRMRNG